MDGERHLRTKLVDLAATRPWLAALLHRAGRRVAARHRVGVVAVVLDDAGRVLVVEHALRRPRRALPGGWVNAHEQPADAVVRELREELGLDVRIGGVLDAESHRYGVRPRRPTPSALTIAYRCVPAGPSAAVRPAGGEVRSVAWCEPSSVLDELTPFDAAAVRAARAG